MQSYSRVLSVSVMCLMLASAAGAQSATPTNQSVAEPNTITVSPFFSVSFGTGEGLGSSVGVGAAVEYDITKNLGVEFEFAHVFDVAGDDPIHDFHLTNFSGSVIYHFDVPRVTPYAAAGLGWEYATSEVQDPEQLALYPASSTEVAWNFGGGVKIPMNERFLARIDLRRFLATDLAPDHWRVYGGVTFWVKRN